MKIKSSALKYYLVQEDSELLSYLLKNNLVKNRTSTKSLLKNRCISVDGNVVSKYNYLLKKGQKIEISKKGFHGHLSTEGVEILFEDKDVIVVNKPCGLLSISADDKSQKTVYRLLRDYVKYRNASDKIFVVHRLDRETSGLMMFAKSENIKTTLQNAWKDIVTERGYYAIVEGKPKDAEGTISSFLYESDAMKVHSSFDPRDGVKAITHYSLLQSNKHYSLLKVNLETGKKNQIRVHMQELGNPVIGDKKYGAKTNPINRLGLHAFSLGFKHPLTREDIFIETKLPLKFRRLMESES